MRLCVRVCVCVPDVEINLLAFKLSIAGLMAGAISRIGSFVLGSLAVSSECNRIELNNMDMDAK